MGIFISAEELKQQLNKGIIIFDCRFRLNDPDFGAEAHKINHIPGAYHLDLNSDLSSPASSPGARHPLPAPQKLTAKLRQAGVTNLSRIVVYDDSRFAFAARAWWLLRWLGLDDVLILNGGFNAWRNAGLPLDRRPPTPRGGNFQPRLNHQQIIEREQILAQAPQQLLLVDSREPVRYKGWEEPIDPIAGHIPGAVNFFWQEVTDAQGFIKDKAELSAHFQTLLAETEIGVYCGSGVTACVNILALFYLDKPAKLYPGSWSDWCAYTDAVIARST